MTMAKKDTKDKKDKKPLKEQMVEHEQDALFREVWEDVRSQKTADFLKKYGKHIITFSIILVFFVALFQYYQNYRQSEYRKEAVIFEDAISYFQKGKMETGVDKLKQVIEKADYGYKDIAYANLYSYYMSAAKHDSASNTIKSMKENAYSDELENLAILKEFMLKSSTATSNEAEDMLEPLLSGSAFKYTAKTLLGYTYFKENELNKAYEIFNQLSNNENVPIVVQSDAYHMEKYLHPRIKTKQ
jgi:hypothetical protein